jgi:hypothetical protein
VSRGQQKDRLEISQALGWSGTESEAPRALADGQRSLVAGVPGLGRRAVPGASTRGRARPVAPPLRGRGKTPPRCFSPGCELRALRVPGPDLGPLSFLGWETQSLGRVSPTPLCFTSHTVPMASSSISGLCKIVTSSRRPSLATLGTEAPARSPLSHLPLYYLLNM